MAAEAVMVFTIVRISPRTGKRSSSLPYVAINGAGE
jgi:hypothetical protein